MNYGYGNWLLVIVLSAIFLFFIKQSFYPQTKRDWRTFHVFSAFIIALFTEMYGFPLTIYLLTSVFGQRFLGLDLSHDSGHILNRILGISGDPHFSYLHVISDALIIVGLILIVTAWDILYKSQRAKVLAQSGPYRYIRHPQYTGFIFIIIGFLFQWPTLITLFMAPMLIGRYIWLAKQEEKEMVQHLGRKYEDYIKNTPMFFPSLGLLTFDIFKKYSKK